MRALVIVALLSTAARAGATRGDLAIALVKGDAATLAASAQFPLGALGLWFDTAPCKRFATTSYSKVTAADLPVLVKCITDLGVTRIGSGDSTQFRYGAGTPLALHFDRAGKLRAIGGTAFNLYVRSDAAPVAPDAFTANIVGFDRELPPRMPDRTKLDGSASKKAQARVEMCVDAKGKVDTVKVELAGSDLPDYDRHVDAVVRTWKTKPFLLRGKPVPACSKFTVGYPRALVDTTGDLSFATPPPPPPAMLVQKIAPEALEARRKTGTKQIVPDDKTKQKMAKYNLPELTGTWRLCLAATGSVSKISVIDSTGQSDYDTKIETEMAKWTFEPFLVDGKPAPVCTSVTVVYSR